MSFINIAGWAIYAVLNESYSALDTTSLTIDHTEVCRHLYDAIHTAHLHTPAAAPCFAVPLASSANSAVVLAHLVARCRLVVLIEARAHGTQHLGVAQLASVLASVDADGGEDVDLALLCR